jgi:hypothetical protein
MQPPIFTGRRGGMRTFMLVRLALLLPLLVTVFLLHVSGTDLVLIHIARIALIGLAVLAGSKLRARRDAERS